MEELLSSTGYQIKSFTRGEKIKAKLSRMGEHSASFDVGGKSEGVVNDIYFSEARNLLNTLKIGDSVDAVVVDPENRDGNVLLSLKNAAQEEFWAKLNDIYKNDEELEVVVRSVNPHGLVASIENETAFIPSSQLSTKVSDKGEDVVGEHVKTKIIDLDQDNTRIVLSERAVSEADQIKQTNAALKAVKPGEHLTGIVRTVTSFGAFVEVKVTVGNLPAQAGKEVPIEGLVHVSEMSWAKVDRPDDVVAEGDKVEVVVLGVERGKLALSMKQAESDPWEAVSKKYKADDKVKGKVVRVSDFGAFVEIEPGVEGLIHMTKIPPGTALKAGQEVSCYIEEVDTKAKKISLGMVVTSSKPVGYR